jgi:hypothetical protein
LYGFGFLSGLVRTFFPFEGPFGSEVSGSMMVVFAALFVFSVVVFIPLALLGVIGLQVVNPMSNERWHPPRHDSNPLYLRNPLYFFHFVAFFIAAMGIGSFLGATWAGWAALAAGAGGVLAGGSIYMGLRLSMRVYHWKIAAERAQDE